MMATTHPAMLHFPLAGVAVNLWKPDPQPTNPQSLKSAAPYPSPTPSTLNITLLSESLECSHYALQHSPLAARRMSLRFQKFPVMYLRILIPRSPLRWEYSLSHTLCFFGCVQWAFSLWLSSWNCCCLLLWILDSGFKLRFLEYWLYKCVCVCVFTYESVYRSQRTLDILYHSLPYSLGTETYCFGG